MATERRVHILQLRPEDETADAEFAAILRYGGLAAAEVERIRLEQRARFPQLDLDACSAIIVGGSPFDVTTPAAQKSEIQRRIEAGFMQLFDRVVPDDVPFLGCCSGNGLLGRYLGGPMSRRFAEPVGGATIQLTSEAADDPLLHGLPQRFRVLLGHKEACDETPPGAVLLAHSDGCPVQMFRVGQHVYATQFHPEGDAEGFRLRIRAYREHGYFPPADAERLEAAVSGEHTPHAHELLRRFVERYRGH